jgi:hypothetical protein
MADSRGLLRNEEATYMTILVIFNNIIRSFCIVMATFIVTGYRLGSFPGRDRDLPLCRHVQASSAPHSSYPVDTEDSLLGNKMARA